MNSLIITSLEQGLIFSVLAMGVFLSYKILDMPDLSVEGTFPFGAFIFAKLISTGINPIISTLMAFCFGTLAGLLTSTLFIKLKIKPLLAGILTMTMLYSVNLKTNGKANIPLFSYGSIFDLGSTLMVLIIIVLFIKIGLDQFLKTETGYLLIATGDNEALVRSLGENSNKYKVLGLMMSNGLVALSGALMAQMQGFVDITMGSSIIVVALASIIIGDTLRKNSNILKSTTRGILGAIIYKLIGGIAIDLGLDPSDLKAISAIIVIIFISYNNFSINLLGLKGNKGGNKYVKDKKPIKEF
jgi:putative ABC transport system permease protein